MFCCSLNGSVLWDLDYSSRCIVLYVADRSKTNCKIYDVYTINKIDNSIVRHWYESNISEDSKLYYCWRWFLSLMGLFMLVLTMLLFYSRHDLVSLMDDNWLAKNVVFRIIHGINRRGRPSREWTDDIKEWYRTDAQTLSIIAQDRSEWRRVVIRHWTPSKVPIPKSQDWSQLIPGFRD